MIDRASLTLWQNIAPWGNGAQVEQDLILSRALVDIYNHTYLNTALAFRGGTALQKLFYDKATRYSEDLDFVQILAGGIGGILDGFREVLEPWLGKPKKKFGEGRATLLYGFEPSLETQVGKMRVKIEINTREHYTVLGLTQKKHEVNTPWYTGRASVTTYHLEELLGTKLRALYQRKKGRDLYDLACALREFNFDVKKSIQCFDYYLAKQDLKISRAEFEENMQRKFIMSSFREDIQPLLSNPNFNDEAFIADFNLVMQSIIQQLPGEAWKGDVKTGYEDMMIARQVVSEIT